MFSTFVNNELDIYIMSINMFVIWFSVCFNMFVFEKYLFRFT